MDCGQVRSGCLPPVCRPDGPLAVASLLGRAGGKFPPGWPHTHDPKMLYTPRNDRDFSSGAGDKARRNPEAISRHSPDLGVCLDRENESLMCVGEDREGSPRAKPYSPHGHRSPFFPLPESDRPGGPPGRDDIKARDSSGHPEGPGTEGEKEGRGKSTQSIEDKESQEDIPPQAGNPHTKCKQGEREEILAI